MDKAAKSRAEGVLGHLFTQFNRRLFGNRLPRALFLFIPEKKGVFNLASDGQNIIVGGGFAGISSVEELYEHLLHTMVHLANHLSNQRDCTSNQYHNKRFLESALGVGLYVAKHRTRGWEITGFDASEGAQFDSKRVEVRRAVVANIGCTKNHIQYVQQYIGHLAGGTGKPKKCFLKYICACPPPHNSIRSGRRPDGSNPINAVCTSCGSRFQHVDE